MISKFNEFPLVSVVIPSYNHAQFLADAINSVINQTYTDWEILIIDNHSSDNTDKVLAQFNDSRISIFKVRNHGSIALSRNRGCAQAQGEWIAFLDSDDYWSADKLMVCSQFFKPNFDLIYHDLEVLNHEFPSQPRKVINCRQVKSPVFIDLLFKGNTIATSSVIVRKSILNKVGGMSEAAEMSGVEDYNAWLKISKITDNFKHVKKHLGIYRLHGTNISNYTNFAPPFPAVAEYLTALSDKDRAKIELNFIYVSARLKFLSGFYDESRIELNKVIRSLRIGYTLKAIWMIVYGILVSANKGPRGR